jgi:hypothetical protein
MALKYVRVYGKYMVCPLQGIIVPCVYVVKKKHKVGEDLSLVRGP